MNFWQTNLDFLFSDQSKKSSKMTERRASQQPIYKGATVNIGKLLYLVSFWIQVLYFLDEIDDGADVFEFIPDDQNENADPDNIIDSHRKEMRSYFEASFETEELCTAKGQSSLRKDRPTPNDPRQYDYSESPRLLKDRYYEEFSRESQCRVYISETVDNDINGALRDPKKIRKYIDGLEIAQEKRKKLVFISIRLQYSQYWTFRIYRRSEVSPEISRHQVL